MALTTLTLAELYEEVADLARDQGASDRVVWNELVEDVVEGHVSLGEIDLDQDTEGMKEELSAKWFQFKKEMAEAEDEDEKEDMVPDNEDEDAEVKDEKETDDAFDDMGDGDTEF